MNTVRNGKIAMVLIAVTCVVGLWKIVMMDRTDPSSEVRPVPYRTSSMKIGGG